MITLPETHTIYPIKMAHEKAQALNKESVDFGDGWVYKVCPNPKDASRAIIKIYDEDNEFVGYL